MSGTGELIDCQRRKSALLERSASHRRVLRREVESLRPVAEWVDLGIDTAGKARAGWSVLAPLISLWQTRQPEPGGFVHKVAGAFSLARSLAELWKNRR